MGLRAKDFLFLIYGKKVLDNAIPDSILENTPFTTGVRGYMARSLLEDVITLSIISVGILFATIYFIHTHALVSTVNVYYPVSNTGRVIPITDIAKKNHSDAYAASFALKVIKVSYNYNYTNWRYQLNRLESYFKLTGWKNYEDSLIAHHIIASLKYDNLNVYSTVAGKPVLMGDGVVNDSYMWRFRVPLNMYYTTKHGAGEKKLAAIVTIAEANPDFHSEGLRIQSITASNRSN
jgi:hypothetical protein